MSSLKKDNSDVVVKSYNKLVTSYFYTSTGYQHVNDNSCFYPTYGDIAFIIYNSIKNYLKKKKK